MKAFSYKISDSLFLIEQKVGQAQTTTTTTETPVNHLVLIDCSGSMYSDLPRIREQLKRKVPKLLKKEDTLSIIWFSGRGQCGTLLEAEPVATLTDLKTVEQAIDRWLSPQGLTGFKDPIEEASRVIDRIAKKSSSAFSLFFMSDGCDNQWSRQDILKAVEQTGQKVSAATIVEYGYYADRPLLTQMAEKAGGTLIFAEDFDRYAPTFEGAMQRKVSGAPRVEVKIPGDTIGGFAYTMAGADLVTYAVENGSVKVAPDSGSVWYLSPTPVTEQDGNISWGEPIVVCSKNSTNSTLIVDQSSKDALSAAYAALSLYSQRMKSDVVFALLKATGDVTFIEQFANCFGKQKYSEFMEATKQATFEAPLRLVKGFNPDRVPAEDAFTVLDLLNVLASDDDNRILLDSEDFRYSKIGRGRVDSTEVLTAEEQAEVAQLTEEMGKTKDAKKVTELAGKIASITNKPEALKFEQAKQEDGYPINSLTYNEERPNVSFLVRKTGTVDITERAKGVAAIQKGGVLPVPLNFPSFVFRNYAVIKDGLVNVKQLPVRLTAGTVKQLTKQGMPFEVIRGLGNESAEDAVKRVKKASKDRQVNVVFDLTALPVINRQMVKATSAKILFEREYELTKARAAQKVYNTYKKERFPRESKGFKDNYGDEATTWLKEQGLTDYSGFAPKVVQAESTDFYMGKELSVSLKGLSTLPSLKDVKDKMQKGKLTPSAALMAPYVTEVEDFLAGKPSDDDLSTFLDTKAREATAKVRGLLFEMAQIRFSIIVGQTWPVEFKSLDECQLTIDVDGQKIEGKVEQKEVEIRI